ncbi:MAG: hypothetical protein ACK6DP_05690 [Gemmatimonas sp.]|jgi:hypothetical protein|uniref:hypothetical protein n=1 Tax=Gemmatimonas sp. TaxID=1962908 RepID=UPI00391F643B|nr:hypothetical protein [Gemmatimonadota bacterium]
MPGQPERFDHLLQQKLDELDAAAAEEAWLEVDAVEQLRLRAAHLVTGEEGRRWPTGAAVQFQQDPGAQRPAPPVLDIRYPARRAAEPVAGGGAETSPQRPGRGIPRSGTPSQ